MHSAANTEVRAVVRMARHVCFFCFLSNWTDLFGALRKLRTLRIGSGGTAQSQRMTEVT